MLFRKPFIVLSVICMFFLIGCGPKALAPKATLDTPLHHVTTGKKLLKTGKIDAAFSEFNRAKELSPGYAPAYIGLGICYGYRADFENGLGTMKSAGRYAKTKEEKAGVGVGYIRLYSMGRGKVDKSWLKSAKKEFDKVKNIDPGLPESYYYMGLAYKISYQFQKAAELFIKVLELDKGFVAEADKEYAIVQKIERAMPGSETGRKIALVEKLTRADAAALFVQELKIDELFKKRKQKEFDTAFKSQENKFVTGVYIKISPATDILNHVLKADIDTVIALGIKGLQPFPDHTFKPEKLLTRAEYAMMMEEILIQISGVDQLATRFIGSSSPFPDLRSDLPFFNAVMTCTTRGIMAAKDLSTGEFDPMGPVSGAEAVLGIRALKSQL